MASIVSSLRAEFLRRYDVDCGLLDSEIDYIIKHIDEPWWIDAMYQVGIEEDQ